MLNGWEIDVLRQKLVDRFTPDEFADALGLTVEDMFDMFFEDCIEKNWDEYL